MVSVQRLAVLASPPEGYRKIQVLHTDEFRAGDVVHIDFPVSSAGFWKYGGNESFTVTESEKGHGIRFIDGSGSVPFTWWLYGSYPDMVGMLSKASSFNSIDIYRLQEGEAPSPLVKGVPASYRPVTGDPFSEHLRPGTRLVHKEKPGFVAEIVSDPVAISSDNAEKYGSVGYETVVIQSQDKAQIGQKVLLGSKEIGKGWTAYETAESQAKIPWFLIIGGAAVTVVILYVILKRKGE